MPPRARPSYLRHFSSTETPSRNPSLFLRGNHSRSSSFCNSFQNQLLTLSLRLYCAHYRCQLQHLKHGHRFSVLPSRTEKRGERRVHPTHRYLLNRCIMTPVDRSILLCGSSEWLQEREVAMSVTKQAKPLHRAGEGVKGLPALSRSRRGRF